MDKIDREIWEIEKEKIEPLRLRLMYDGCNKMRIKLIAVDKKGRRLENGSILDITPSGRVELIRGVDTNLGLDLDEEKRIKLV